RFVGKTEAEEIERHHAAPRGERLDRLGEVPRRRGEAVEDEHRRAVVLRPHVDHEQLSVGRRHRAPLGPPRLDRDHLATLGTLPARASARKCATSACAAGSLNATKCPSYPLGPYSRTAAVTGFPPTVRLPERGTASGVRPPMGSGGEALGAGA